VFVSIFVLDFADQKFYDRQDSSFQLNTDSSAGKLQVLIQMIDWLINWMIDFIVA
jgi:hypothetical protein